MSSTGGAVAHPRRELTEAQSFERLRVRLRALTRAAPPFVDPRALALRALLVTDRLAQPDLQRKVEALGRAGACDPRSVEDLRVAARALLHVLSRLGEQAPALAPGPPESIRSEALRLRAAGVESLEAVDSDDVRLWVEVFALPFDDADLVFDLRALARLHEESGETLGAAASAAAAEARRCADLLQTGLGGKDDDLEWRPWLDRAFSLTLSLYEEVCRIGRFVTATGGAAVAFPSLASVVRSRRRGVTPASSHDRLRVGPRGPVIEPQSLGLLPALSPAGLAAPPATPPVPPPEALAPTEPSTAKAPTRRESRFNVEIEIDVLSDSNFYVGFTENLSGSGLFVATYFLRPLGSRVEMRVRVPGRSQPMSLQGEVRWIREPTATRDAWPGMGIEFDGISDEDRATIAAFLATRDPLFFVE